MRKRGGFWKVEGIGWTWRPLERSASLHCSGTPLFLSGWSSRTPEQHNAHCKESHRGCLGHIEVERSGGVASIDEFSIVHRPGGVRGSRSGYTIDGESEGGGTHDVIQRPFLPGSDQIRHASRGRDKIRAYRVHKSRSVNIHPCPGTVEIEGRSFEQKPAPERHVLTRWDIHSHAQVDHVADGALRGSQGRFPGGIIMS